MMWLFCHFYWISEISHIMFGTNRLDLESDSVFNEVCRHPYHLLLSLWPDRFLNIPWMFNIFFSLINLFLFFLKFQLPGSVKLSSPSERQISDAAQRKKKGKWKRTLLLCLHALFVSHQAYWVLVKGISCVDVGLSYFSFPIYTCKN